MNSQALPYIILLGLIWGSNLVVSRYGLSQFNAFAFIALRLLLAALMHGAVYIVDRRRTWPRDRRLWRHALLLGVIGTAIPMTGIIASLQYLSSGMTAIFVSAVPAITVLLAHFFLDDETLNRRKSLGISLALAGALLLALSGESGLPDVEQANPLGFVLVITGVLVGSATSVYARRYMRDFDAFDAASIRMLGATIVVSVSVLFFVGYDFSQVDGRGVLSLSYAAIFGTFAGLLLEFWIIQRFGATSAAMTAYVIPVVATFGGAIFLSEQITATILVGMALIIAGIAIINRRRRPRPEPFIPHP